MIRRGRPGLVGTMARTAVVAGTATGVSNRMTRRANQRALEEEQAEAYQQLQTAPAAQAAQAVPTAGAADPVQQLSELADLKARGMLSEQEFEAAKAKLLG